MWWLDGLQGIQQLNMTPIVTFIHILYFILTAPLANPLLRQVQAPAPQEQTVQWPGSVLLITSFILWDTAILLLLILAKGLHPSSQALCRLTGMWKPYIRSRTNYLS